jgi:hypothetical protein
MVRSRRERRATIVSGSRWPSRVRSRPRVRSATIVAGLVLLTACGDSSVSAPQDAALVTVGRAVDGSGSAITGAIVAVQTFWPGRLGSRFGCTGEILIGQWTVTTAADGEFGLYLRLRTPSSPICVVVLGAPPGQSVWSDTASVLAPFTVTPGVAPDTVRFELRLAR